MKFTTMLAGKDVPQTVVDFAKQNHVSQIFVALYVVVGPAA
jgi:hypothetical protein